MTQKITEQELTLRAATLDDVEEMHALSCKVYGDLASYKSSIQSQVTIFPEGQIVAVYKDRIVGHAAAFITEETTALAPHSWAEITGGGKASRHNPHGDMLYGMEVCVDPQMRGKRVGKRLYNMRKKLCRAHKLKGIAIGGRLPNFKKNKLKKKDLTPAGYLEAVKEERFADPVIGFQLSNGFKPIGILENYLPSDKESGGYAVHMLWRNAA